MADYIERQAALDLVESAGTWGWSKNQLYEEMQAVPAANVREDVQGEWIEKKVMIRTPAAKNYFCSVCKEEGFQTIFCPNCGARMVGGDYK